jgi:serine/threonine protein kinase
MGSATLVPKRRIGAYELVEKLGAGGLGEVWKARDPRLNRIVALKFLTIARPGSTSAVDLLAEARAASALNHPNIVTIFEVGESDAGTYLAMEFVDGQTLRCRLGRAPAPPSDAVEIARQIAEALAAAHRAGIVHRDLKPENIMLRVDGYVKLLDFGLAKKLPSAETVEEVSATLTQAGQLVGTLPYMSPEQARGQKVTAASDVFSLGIILHEMLTGEHPFGAANVMDTVLAILSKPPGSLSQRCPSAPPAVAAIVQRALMKEPQARYPSALELLQDLRQALTAPTPAVAVPPPAKRPVWIAGIVTAALAIVLAVGTWSVRASREPQMNAVPVQSIAVLNLRTPPEEANAASFSEALVEDLGTSLSRSGFRVVSRGTVESVSGGDTRTIGGQLGVDSVLEGSIRQVGNNYKLHLELASVRTGFQLWSENFLLDPQDLLSGNEKTAAKIAEQLRAGLANRQR